MNDCRIQSDSRLGVLGSHDGVPGNLKNSLSCQSNT